MAVVHYVCSKFCKGEKIRCGVTTVDARSLISAEFLCLRGSYVECKEVLYYDNPEMHNSAEIGDLAQKREILLQYVLRRYKSAQMIGPPCITRIFRECFTLACFQGSISTGGCHEYGVIGR